MALSAQDVHDKQFKLVRNATGYDMDEVDSFLDEVESEISRLADELAQAQQRLAEQEAAASAPVPAASPSETAIAAAARILELAQRTADDYLAEAKQTAENVVSDADKAARKSVKKLEGQRSELESRVTALRTFESEIRSRLSGYFQSQLADLDTLAGGDK
ncbi:MAG: DivIVA domain-containing protein [Candidatus Nanopelagicales bacterium]